MSFLDTAQSIGNAGQGIIGATIDPTGGVISGALNSVFNLQMNFLKKITAVKEGRPQDIQDDIDQLLRDEPYKDPNGQLSVSWIESKIAGFEKSREESARLAASGGTKQTRARQQGWVTAYDALIPAYKQIRDELIAKQQAQATNTTAATKTAPGGATSAATNNYIIYGAVALVILLGIALYKKYSNG